MHDFRSVVLLRDGSYTVCYEPPSLIYWTQIFQSRNVYTRIYVQLVLRCHASIDSQGIFNRYEEIANTSQI